MKLSETLLRCHVGDLMITDAGEFGPGAKLFLVHWGGGNFVTQKISYFRPDTSPGHFEHVTFAPINLPALTQ